MTAGPHHVSGGGQGDSPRHVLNGVPHAVPRIVIAGASSGVGKTTMTAGLIAALRQRGLTVQPFKCGPDYIDPSYHERAAGRPCRNLDAWMLNDAQLLEGFSRACRGADIAVIEGVMGLFDGSDWHDERASTAQIAKLLGAPLLLVVDIAGAARSAAAVVLGCQQFDPDLALRGVLLNFAGSEAHAKGCGEAITSRTGLPMLGWLPRRLGLEIPERHLGLVPGAEHSDPDALIARIAGEIMQRFDLAAVLHTARTAGALPGIAAQASRPHEEAGAYRAVIESTSNADEVPSTHRPVVDESTSNANEAPGAHRGVITESTSNSHQASSTHRPVIAVARDAAFCFYYPENLELLTEAGADIEFFSPLKGECPSSRAGGVYLGGGYPELHGAALAANVELWRVLRDLRSRNVPIYAECGGFMVLTEGLIDREGRRWPMAALVPGVTRMTDKLAALGYRHAVAQSSNLLVDGGEALRGHEFRYSNWVCEAPITAGDTAWRVSGSRGAAPSDSAGFVSGNLLASYVHIHFGQRAGIARRFVEKLQS
jgi:cobyrinic acid a,c-diamide synthase